MMEKRFKQVLTHIMLNNFCRMCRSTGYNRSDCIVCVKRFTGLTDSEIDELFSETDFLKLKETKPYRFVKTDEF